LRLIKDPGQQYKPLTPPWLARAAEVASSAAPPLGAAAPPTALAALPAPVREPLRQLQEAVAAGQVADHLGRAALRSLFLLEKGTTYLNHGRWVCCVLLCCAVLCCAVLCCAVLCCAVRLALDEVRGLTVASTSCMAARLALPGLAQLLSATQHRVSAAMALP
jgi:hypothetical protein